MRTAVISGSVIDGVRIASEIEKAAGVDACVLAFPPRKMNVALRCAREIAWCFRRWNYLAAMLRFLRQGRIVFFRRLIDEETSIEKIKSLHFDVGIHNLNVIYRGPVIAAFKRGILNCHIGLLPRYRGRCVAEWSILEGTPTGVTVFFIDDGIDTGRDIVLRGPVEVSAFRSIAEMKSHLFDLNAVMYRRALELVSDATHPFTENDVEKGCRFYPMSSLFTGIVQDLLRNNNG